MGENNREIAISMVFPIMKAVAGGGHDPDDFFAYASFDARLLRDVEARITSGELERLMNAAAAYTDDAYFGLHQGQMTDFADMGILGYVMMHSGTVAEALTAYRRYNDLLCSGFNLDAETDRSSDLVRVLLFTQHGGPLSRHCAEDMASSMHRMIGGLASKPVQLHAVSFVHEAPASADMAPYARVFGVEPSFGQAVNALVMSKEVLDYPVLYSDPRLLAMFKELARETQDGLLEHAKLSRQIWGWIKSSLPTFLPTLRQTAERFDMSERTLQHKLQGEGTSYHELSAQLRKEVAMSYLQKPEYSMADIAYALHFSEPSAFQSAFRKWTGLTPGQYRAHTAGRDEVDKKAEYIT